MIKLAAKLTLLVSVLALGGCGDDDGPAPTSDGGWLVGEDGTMFRVDPEAGVVERYDLDRSLAGVDFYAIACRGSDAAWVGGSGSTLLRTLDSGRTWETLDAIESGVTIRAIATAARDIVFAVGERASGGMMARSEDSGQTWNAIDAGASVPPFTDVTTTADGSIALLTGLDGSIWRWDETSGLVMAIGGGTVALRSISINADGTRAVAVGDLGRALASDDGGRSWNAVPSATTNDLFAVQLAAITGDEAVAVGASGTFARIRASDAARATGVAAISESGLADGRTLRAVHWSIDGHGLVVGDGGALLESYDNGATFDTLETHTGVTLTAVDHLGGEPHF